MRCFLWMMWMGNAWSFVLSGLWKANNLLVRIQQDKLTGIFDHSIMEMNIDCDLDKNRVRLFNFQVVKRPPDWYNVSKYKSYIRIYKKIQKDGLECEVSFMDPNRLRVGSLVDGKHYEFFMSRMTDDKNELKM